MPWYKKVCCCFHLAYLICRYGIRGAKRILDEELKRLEKEVKENESN